MNISKIFEHFKNIIIGIAPMCVQVGGFLEVTVKQEEEDPATDQDNIAESPGESSKVIFKGKSYFSRYFLWIFKKIEVGNLP